MTGKHKAQVVKVLHRCIAVSSYNGCISGYFLAWVKWKKTTSYGWYLNKIFRYYTFSYLLIPSYFSLPPDSNLWTRKHMKRNSECKRKPCTVGSNLQTWHKHSLLQSSTDLNKQRSHQSGLKQRDPSSCSTSAITWGTIRRVSFGPWAQKGYSNTENRNQVFSSGSLSSFCCLLEMPNMRYIKDIWFSG